MNLIYTTIIVLLVLCVKVLYPSTISGKIIDAETNKPLVGANVSIEKIFKGVSCGLDGDYEINNIPLGTHIVRINFHNYCDIIDTITILSKGQILKNDYSLVKNNRKVYLTELESFNKYHNRMENLYAKNKNLFILSFTAIYELDSSAVIVNPEITNNHDQSIFIPKRIDHYIVRINNKRFRQIKDITVLRCPIHIFSKSYESGDLIEIEPGTTKPIKSFFMRNQDLFGYSRNGKINISLTFDFNLADFVYTDDCSEKDDDIIEVYNKILRLPLKANEQQFKL